MKSLCIVIKDELFKFEAHIYEIILFIYLYLQGYNLTWYSSSSIILHSPIKGIHKYFFVLAILRILIIPVNENRFAFVKKPYTAFFAMRTWSFCAMACQLSLLVTRYIGIKHSFFVILADFKNCRTDRYGIAFVEQAIYHFLCRENMKLLRYGLWAISSCYKICWH